MLASNTYSQTANFTSQQRYRIQNIFGYADFGTSNIVTNGYYDLFTNSFITFNTISQGPFPYYQIKTDKYAFSFDKPVLATAFVNTGPQLTLGFTDNTATPVVLPALIIKKAGNKLGLGHNTALTVSAKLDIKTTDNIEGLRVNTSHTVDWLTNTWLTVNRNNSQALKISNSNYNGSGMYSDVFKVMGDGSTSLGSPTGYSTSWGKLNIYANKYQPGLNVNTFSDNINMECIVASVNDGYHKALVVKLNGSENFKVNGSGYFYARGGKIMTGNFPDFVFEKDYKYMNYNEKEAYLKTNKHLPYLPGAKEINAEGLDIGNIIKGVTQNVEENTLDILAISKELELLKQLNKKLLEELKLLKNEK